MISNKEKIDAKYLKKHAKLEAKYYKDRALTKEEFDALHGALWRAYTLELLGIRWEEALQNVYRHKVVETSCALSLKYIQGDITLTELDAGINFYFDEFEGELVKAGYCSEVPPTLRESWVSALIQRAIELKEAACLEMEHIRFKMREAFEGYLSQIKAL